MAKDPATLWYWGDWHSGTVTFSRHLKGCYIDLLHAQFNNGHLSLEEIKTVLGNDFAAWGTLSKKFEVDETGKFFNARLDLEKARRKAFVQSQSDKGKKGGRPPNNPGVKPNLTPPQPKKESGNEIENETVITGGAGGIPSQAQVEDIFKKSGLTEADGEDFYLWVSGAKGWSQINNWLDYTMATVRRKLNEKKYNGKQRDTRREPAPHGTKFGNL